MARNESGFTLIEVLVVTVLIGVLAGIAIVHYTDMKARGLDSQVASVVRNVATGEEAYFASRLRYVGALDELDGIVTGGVAVAVASGNSGDLGSSFRVHGVHESDQRMAGFTVLLSINDRILHSACSPL